jgi:heme-degrading monooxygenase HmoA
MSGLSSIAQTPNAPCYAVIFTSIRTDRDRGSGKMADLILKRAFQMPEFLGVESVRGPDGVGITISYWKSEDAIAGWKAHAQHQVARAAVKSAWHAGYVVRVARVDCAYGKVPNAARAAAGQRQFAL